MFSKRCARVKLMAQLGFLLIGIAFQVPEGKASDQQNPLFAYTHLQPSPFTLPAGSFVLGTYAAFGITDFLQIGTDILRDAYGIFNAQAKASLIDYYQFALALTLGFQTYNLNNLSSSNPDVQVTSWLPGGVTAFALHERLALFLGGQFQITDTDIAANSPLSSGGVNGGSVGADLSFSYNPPGDHPIGNALSMGATYDFTYSVFGFGVSHHWPGFHLGIHYFFGADERPVYPIIQGGTRIQL